MSPDEAAAYRRQAEQEMREQLAAIRLDVDQEMERFAREQGIQIDDTDTDTDDNEEDENTNNISKKDFLELMKNIRIRLAGPLPGEPNANYLTKKKPPDNSEGEGHAYTVSAHGGKKNKKKRRRKTKRKRKKKKRKTKRR